MLECKRCNNTWIQRGDSKPKTCPECNSRVWDKELTPYWQDQKEKRAAAKLALIEKEANNE